MNCMGIILNTNEKGYMPFLDTPVTSFDHYVYYDKVTKDEIGSSVSLNNG